MKEARDRVQNPNPARLWGECLELLHTQGKLQPALGEAFQTDFTHATELHVTILGEPYDHLYCVTTLPYSTWSKQRYACSVMR